MPTPPATCKRLITHRYLIEQAQQAFDDLSSGRNARGMIMFNEV